MSVRPKPVFFDAKGIRARVTNAILAAITFVLLAGLATVGLSIFVAPSLPRLAAPRTKDFKVADAASTFVSGPSGLQLNPARNRQLPDQAAHAKRFAFFVNLDSGSLASLKRNAAELDAIIPDWLDIAASER